MTYDQWKTRSPDDELYRYCSYREDDHEDDCDHDDYESDILTGEAWCNRCDHKWIQTPEEIAREIERIREHDEWQRREERSERWRQLTSPFRWAWYRIWNPISPRTAIRSLRDEEIPF